ncbi:MAG: hypothetical protein ACOYMN_24700, partial [Roseimicrobium sp.]
MKALATILTCTLLAVMAWLMLDARSDARGARNQLELMRRQSGGPTEAEAPNPALDAMEHQLVLEQQKRKQASPAPTLEPAPAPLASAAIPSAPSPFPGLGEANLSPAIANATAAPPPMTPRQRQIMAAPSIAEVKEYAKDYGFVVITSGAGRKIEKGMTFAVRRGSSIIGRIKVTEVEDASAVADLD